MKKNTGKAPSIQFYYKDFLADMSEHDPDIVGAWMLVLIKIWHTDNGGSVTKTLSQFSKIMNTDQVGARRFIDYFRAENIANVTDDNDKITIVNRRSKRDANLREQNKLRQEKFRKKDGKFGNNTNITPKLHHPSSSSSSSSSTSIKKKKGNFIPPTVCEVLEYSKEINYNLNADSFINSYEQKGWMVGKNKMKCWKSAVRNWKSNGWGKLAVQPKTPLEKMAEADKKWGRK